MDKELIEWLARDAGFSVEPLPLGEPGEFEIGTLGSPSVDFQAELHRFAALVAEECAKVADNITYGDPGSAGVEQGIAADIRAKFTGPT
jgi:hypothetical protein